LSFRTAGTRRPEHTAHSGTDFSGVGSPACVLRGEIAAKYYSHRARVAAVPLRSLCQSPRAAPSSFYYSWLAPTAMYALAAPPMEAHRTCPRKRAQRVPWQRPRTRLRRFCAIFSTN